MDRGFRGERDPRRTHAGRRVRLFVLQDVGPRHRGRDDLGRRQKLGVPAAVIGVIVRVDDVLDRLVRDALHLVHDALMILIEFIVDQDDAFVGDVDGDVASVAFDLIQIVLHFVESEFRGRRVLRV